MNKYELITNCREHYEMGFNSATECMDRIIDGWTEANGGHMSADELAEMVEYIESIEWHWMAHLMQGYLWGAAIDDEWELKGEQLRNQRSI